MALDLPQTTGDGIEDGVLQRSRLAHPPLLRHIRGRRLYGGVAYLREHEGTSRYAERKGLFVIRATGSSASIVNPPEFQPRDFVPPTT